MRPWCHPLDPPMITNINCDCIISLKWYISAGRRKNKVPSPVLDDKSDSDENMTEPDVANIESDDTNPETPEEVSASKKRKSNGHNGD